jgi:CRISPR-associated endonuclease/helicase Cas3
MSKFNHLLGKQPEVPGNPVKEETLFGHTLRVFGMAKLLTGLLGLRLKSMLQLDPTTVKHWEKAVWIASWMHDWGKANDHFQTMIRNPSFKQGVRHEAISLIMAKEAEKWLEPIWDDLPLWSKCAALYSISGHHLKFPDPYSEVRTGTEVTLLFDHPDFRHLLLLGCDFFQLPAFPQTENKVYNLFARGNLIKQLKLMQRELDHDFDDKEKVLISAAKATLMVADLAGSALPKKVDDPEKWLNDRLLQTLSTEQLEQVVSQKIGTDTPHQFQHTIREAKSKTVLVEAGCGSGKTVAAYLWASRNAVGKRLFFCYPTTTTASEGFAGYMHDPDFDAILMHSRARTDYRLLENMPNPTHEENELRYAGLEALESWPIPVAVCTVHTVLGILENVRRSIFAWPSLMQSVFVFDEIHAYSNRLFSYLLRFLKAFTGIQVLLMTATLPPSRKKVLEETCRIRGGVEVIYGPKEREVAERYILEKSTLDRVWTQIEETLNGGGKILWVSNTVKKTMEHVDTCLQKQLPVQPFHSRYRYKDRLQRQQTLVRGFSAFESPILAITTQVAEMSLDISADLLITEHAPIAAMIQRLGRLNRFEERPKILKKAILIEPDMTLPYSKEDWVGVSDWLDKVADGEPKSQSDLSEAFIDLTDTQTSDLNPIAFCEWLDGLWRTLKDQRAIEEVSYSIEIVREEDQDGDPVENAIPMPVPKIEDWQNWSRLNRYLIAPKGSLIYDGFKGGRWN